MFGIAQFICIILLFILNTSNGHTISIVPIKPLESPVAVDGAGYGSFFTNFVEVHQ